MHGLFHFWTYRAHDCLACATTRRHSTYNNIAYPNRVEVNPVWTFTELNCLYYTYALDGIGRTDEQH